MLVTSTSISPSQSSFPESFNLSGFLTFTLMGRCFGILSTTSRSALGGDCARPATSPQAATGNNREMSASGAMPRRRGVGREA